MTENQIHIEVRETRALSSSDKNEIVALFGANYDQTDPAYTDQSTGIVKGSGRPVGYPKLSFEPSPDEEILFQNVDRANGDSAWLPAAPVGWSFGTCRLDEP